MNFLVIFHIATSAFIAACLYLWGAPAMVSAFLVGTTLSLANVVLLHFAWKRILEKKLVALSAGVIVIKYATLGFIIYRIASRNLFQLEWLCVGLGVILVSAVATAIYLNRTEPNPTE